jgi:two-component system LytT family response regulator
MSPISVLVVDDESISRRRLRRLLSHDPDVELSRECSTGEEALEYLASNPNPDLLFLDIQMPGMDGFAFLKQLSDRDSSEHSIFTVFVTAYDHFALKALQVHAFDYLLKPYEEMRLQETVRHAKRQMHLRGANTSHLSAAITTQTPANIAIRRDRLAVKVGENLHLLRLDSVDWIEAADNYVYLHCGKETFTLRETMTALERALDPGKFLRIHRSAIVNLDRIKTLQPWFRGDYRVLLSTGKELTLSRSYRHNLRECILNL